MFTALTRVLRTPQAFFAEQRTNERLARYSVWIVLIYALVSSIQAYLSTRPLAQGLAALPELDSEAVSQIASTVTLGFAVIGAFMFSFASWFVIGLIVRMTAGLEAKPWTVTAYGYIPVILMTLLGSLALLLFPLDLNTIIADMASGDFMNNDDLFGPNLAIQQELQASVAFRISQALSYVGTAWSLVVIFFAVQALTEMRVRALRTVVVLGGLSLALALGPWLFAPL